ncbi:hypothetical protein [Vandammella animalimorsus]|uniref:hypothetical protein n=1 Tax=Vandammella animalimorsus TaxID=2029117 RepID=UPI00117887E5|nr:hypothetical protein [Vandammella animalimorsus]
MTESPSPGRTTDGHADTPSAQAHGPSEGELQAFWKQALASAPAAGLAPERLAALRQRILADAAHALAAPGHVPPATSPSAWLRLRRAVQKLLHSQGRQPQWAAGLASVCMACLVLMIWYGRWPEAALEDSRPAHHAPSANSAAKPAPPADQFSAALQPHTPPQPEALALPAPAYAPAPPASTVTMQSEAAISAGQQPQAEAMAADATTAHTQPHRQRSSFAAPLAAAALAQPLAQATHWRWATASGQDQGAATPLSEAVRAALQQVLPAAQQPAAAPAPGQARRILLLHEQRVLLQLWLAPGHIQWQQAGGDGLAWLAQPSADAYNRLMRALATDASQPKSQ